MRHAKSNPSEVSTIGLTLAPAQSSTRTSTRSRAALVHELEVDQIELKMELGGLSQSIGPDLRNEQCACRFHGRTTNEQPQSRR